jgi:UDP-N-acetylmuramoyl-tripeptide--D-alanyl-D-alanine ligase
VKLTLGQIADWIHAEGDIASDVEALGYSIDSRTLAAGDLFFAVKGERMDGHDYVQAALANGAVAAVVSHHWLASDDASEVDPTRLLWVPESEDCVLIAMQKLAREVRRAWSAKDQGKRVIGVTGSAGKTTTKEAIATVLAAKYNVLKSAGNLNNHFGVPSQLLRLEPEHEVAVIEMGMNHAGEIAALCRIAEPNWAVVSNVGQAHIEFFPDGMDGIARAKKELLDSLPPMPEGIGFLNADDPRVAAMAESSEWLPILYGTTANAAFRAEEIVEDGVDGIRFIAAAGDERAPVSLHLLGRHNVLNALAAIAVGVASDIPLADCALAIGQMRAPDKRGTILEWRGARIINDCYNSNPAALNAMVDALKSMPAQRRIVVAGEMLELGAAGVELHHACGQHIAAAGIDIVLGIRGLAAALVQSATATHTLAIFLETPAQAGQWLRDNLQPGDAVLLKASRGVKLEQALEALPTDPSQ